MISIHVDDFILAGTDKFMKEITSTIEEKLEISKLQDDAYAGSLEKLDIRKGSSEEKLTETERKVYRKYIGKLT